MLIPEFADDPSRIRQWTNEVCSEISTLQTSSFGGSDVESCLELGIEDV